MVYDWTLTFRSARLVFMHLLYATLFTSISVPKQSVPGSPKNVTPHRVVAGAPGDHPQNFNSPFRSSGTELDSSTSGDYVVITKVPWPTLELTRHGCTSLYEIQKGLFSFLLPLFFSLHHLEVRYATLLQLY